jgi:hypothetical protein
MPESKAFKKLKKSLTENYLGEPVPKQYQKKYGKRYDKKDIKSFAFAVAKSKGIKESY